MCFPRFCEGGEQEFGRETGRGSQKASGAGQGMEEESREEGALSVISRGGGE